jgi:prophage regulatory protein|tara:strand:+ start:408 stop:596 length:189 start_codon:yes stop_codon:yes gene_type:complete
MAELTNDRFLRLKQVVQITSLSKSEIYRRVNDNRFPKQQRRSHKVAVWLQSEVEAWMRDSNA